MCGLNGKKLDLEHIMLWKEMPDGSALVRSAFDAAMLDAGQHAERALESIVGARAQLNARK